MRVLAPARPEWIVVELGDPARQLGACIRQGGHGHCWALVWSRSRRAASRSRSISARLRQLVRGRWLPVGVTDLQTTSPRDNVVGAMGSVWVAPQPARASTSASVLGVIPETVAWAMPTCWTLVSRHAAAMKDATTTNVVCPVCGGEGCTVCDGLGVVPAGSVEASAEVSKISAHILVQIEAAPSGLTVTELVEACREFGEDIDSVRDRVNSIAALGLVNTTGNGPSMRAVRCRYADSRWAPRSGPARSRRGTPRRR